MVLRPFDTRREILRVLRRVELLRSLSVAQLQRLTDLLGEAEYPAGSRIISQGEVGDAFYLIVSGRCDCSINMPPGGGDDLMDKDLTKDTPPPGPGTPATKVVMQLKVP